MLFSTILIKCQVWVSNDRLLSKQVIPRNILPVARVVVHNHLHQHRKQGPGVPLDVSEALGNVKTSILPMSRCGKLNSSISVSLIQHHYTTPAYICPRYLFSTSAGLQPITNFQYRKCRAMKIQTNNVKFLTPILPRRPFLKFGAILFTPAAMQISGHFNKCS